MKGLDLGHRREWIRDRLEELEGALDVEIAAFAVMDNDLHVVARIRPDLAATWSDVEVAPRWLEADSERAGRRWDHGYEDRATPSAHTSPSANAILHSS